MSRTQGRYSVKDVSSYKISIDRNGMPNNISMDPWTPVQISMQQRHACTGGQINSFLNEAPSATQPRDYLQQKLSTDTNYVFDQIVAHRQTPSGTQCRVRWYSYTSKYNTFKAAEHISGHFITKYWKIANPVRMFNWDAWANLTKKPKPEKTDDSQNIWQQDNYSLWSTRFNSRLERLSLVSNVTNFSSTTA